MGAVAVGSVTASAGVGVADGVEDGVLKISS